MIELFIVMAIIMTLSALAVPAYITSLEKARDIRGISNLKQLSNEIEFFRLTSGGYPASLSDLGFVVGLDPWGRPYEYLRLEEPPNSEDDGKDGKLKARKDHNLHPINTDYDLYSKGRDGESNSPLTAKASRDDVIRANNGGFYGLAADY